MVKMKRDIGEKKFTHGHKKKSVQIVEAVIYGESGDLFCDTCDLCRIKRDTYQFHHHRNESIALMPI